MVITCYRINSGFSNVMDTITLERPRDEYIYEEIQVVLPDGYELGNNYIGVPYIYDDRGEHCDLCLNSLHGNAIIAVSRSKMVGLQKAPTGEKPMPLREARLAAKLTTKQLSEISGVAIRQIQKAESGAIEVGNMSARNLLAIADALDIDPHDII